VSGTKKEGILVPFILNTKQDTMFYFQAYVIFIFQVLVKKIAFEWVMTSCSPVKTN